MPRFVVLEHVLPSGPRAGRHFDLMLEAAGVLWTWELREAPEIGSSQSATRLADHRLHYLDYEGPVSGDRGEVRRWDWGEYTLCVPRDEQDCPPATLIVRLLGERLWGEASLVERRDATWDWT